MGASLVAKFVRMCRRFSPCFDFKQKLILGVYLAFLVALLGINFSGEVSKASRSIYGPPDKHIYSEDVAEFEIGLDVYSINNIDLESRTFEAQGWVSMRWNSLPSWLGDYDPKVNKNPALSISLANAIKNNDLHLDASPSTPYLGEDGRYIQWLEFSGLFYIEELDLRKFPFHTVHLPIEIEFDDFTSEEVNVTLRQSDSGLIGSMEFNGYEFDSEDFTLSIREYPTNFGLPHLNTQISSYDNIRYTLNLRRLGLDSFFVVFLPLLTTMAITFATPLISPRHYDTKVVLPASVLLVLVFLQQGYQSMMPRDLGYVTFADFTYNTSMLITILVFVLSVSQLIKY